MNVALDGVLWRHGRAGGALDRRSGRRRARMPLWLLPLGAATLLLAGLPFRLPWQYWRFAGIDDLLTVAGASALGAGLFAGAGRWPA